LRQREHAAGVAFEQGRVADSRHDANGSPAVVARRHRKVAAIGKPHNQAVVGEAVGREIAGAGRCNDLAIELHVGVPARGIGPRGHDHRLSGGIEALAIAPEQQLHRA
jgi:hypothetical protein